MKAVIHHSLHDFHRTSAQTSTTAFALHRCMLYLLIASVAINLMLT